MPKTLRLVFGAVVALATVAPGLACTADPVPVAPAVAAPTVPPDRGIYRVSRSYSRFGTPPFETTTTTTAPAPTTIPTTRPLPSTSAPPAPPVPRGMASSRWAGGAPTPGQWLALRQCESGNNYGDDTGNGFFNAYQFTMGTWNSMMRALGYPQYIDHPLAPAPIQDAAAVELWNETGRHPSTGNWPHCGYDL